ncbi:MAG: ABC transporter ATP-binding protein [Deinococcota bacterium]
MTQNAGVPQAALSVHHLVKRFGPTLAVADMSLTVGAGETVALLGPSGCGKSTVLRCVAGLERPDAGKVWIGEQDVTNLPPEARHVGLVFQEYALFPHLNVVGNVAYGPRMRGAGRAEAARRAQDALALVGLDALAGRRVTELSGGQAQRVALARALATGSPLLLLDEPLSNLDEQLRARLRADLRDLFTRVSAGVLLVTHDQREALALASRVAVMRAGRLMQVGAAREVFARPATAWVAAFLGHANVLSGPDGQARLVPEDAVQLGEGEPYPLTTSQTTDTGTVVTVQHPLGPLTLHLSAREAANVCGDQLRLTLDLARVMTLPDDRERP